MSGATVYANGASELPWTGNLDDDCTCVIGEWLAHCECLGEVIVRDPSEKRGSPSEYWFVGVYRGNEAVFHSGEHAGFIINGEMARALAAAILFGAISEEVGPKGTLILRALGSNLRTLDDLATAIKHDKNSVRVAASRLCTRGLIERQGRGSYFIPAKPRIRFTP